MGLDPHEAGPTRWVFGMEPCEAIADVHGVFTQKAKNSVCMS